MKKVILLGAIFCLATSIWVQRGAAQAFVEQVGQLTDPQLQPRTDIDFKVVQEGGLQVFVSNEGLQYQWIAQAPSSDSIPLYSAYRMDMKLIGANPQARIMKGPQLAAYERYYLSWVNIANQDEGVVAHRYQSILYKDVYPHIDWRLYFTEEGALEYDFLIHPGGDIQQIQWAYSGHDSILQTADGGLIIRTPKGGIVQQAPISFEQASRLSVPSNYIVQGNTVGFQTGSYNGVLVIDPVIKWGTYFGDLADDHCHDIAVDSMGNVYMVGTTNSVSNIATQGAHQQTFGGGSHYLGADAFINKLDTAGQLLWATYYGGTNIDILQRIAIDSAGAIYIAGYSNSTNGIASVNAYQVNKMGLATYYDAVLIKMNAAGVREWGTYFGGSMNDGDEGVALTIDAANNIWIAGGTMSNDLFTSTTAHKTTRQLKDGFVTQFDHLGNVLFSSYYGGTGVDVIKDICVAVNKEIYIIGETKSTSGLATNNAYQSSLGGGTDAYVAKLDSLATPIWATYIGGIYNEVANVISLTDSNVIVGISTSSPNLQFGNAMQLGNNDYDGLVAEIKKDGTVNMVSYLGGNNFDEVTDIMVHKEKIHVLLSSNSQLNFVDSFSLFPNHNGLKDLVWLQFDLNWQKLYATYLGGNNNDLNGNFGAQDQHIYIGGTTMSNNNFGTIGTHQSLNAGSHEAYLIKIADCNPITWSSAAIFGVDSICPNQASLFQVNAQDSVVYHWVLPNSWQGSSDSHHITVTPDIQSGTISVWLSNSCDLQSDTLLKNIGVFPEQTPIIQKQGNVLVCPQSFVSYQWLLNHDSIAGASQNNHIPTLNGWYQLQVIDANGCLHSSDSFLVDYLSLPTPQKEVVQVYPNPVTASLQIKLQTAGVVQIYNVLGQPIASYTLQQGIHSMPVAHWPAGIYSLLLRTGEGSFVYKIEKQ